MVTNTGYTMTIDEIKELVLFMKGQSVQSFKADALEVHFNNAAFINDLLSEEESKSTKDIEREEEDLLYAST